MYLKRLELQGFKSFAPRTILEFSPGITAIVGSNGSGKSNLADAVRWVLGEQSMRQLRGKRSDDIIFVGGQGRAPMQMAEVGLVLDNSAGWLPSERAEVSTARRAFRSGESEYLISGQRVRLRDLLLLLAQARIGHDSYTVIGQGLVDQALSVRPEERRGLFEDAAGIRQFQAQRADAEQKLTLTQSNLARLRDILGEIEPRLEPLAEQARRARDYVGTREELRRLIRIWYAWQWNQLEADDQRAGAYSAQLGEQIESLTQTLSAENDNVRQSRQSREELIARVNQLRRGRGEISGHLQIAERDLAVTQERRGSLDRQATDLEAELQQQRADLAAQQELAQALEKRLTEAEDLADTMATGVEALERGQHSMRQEQEREEARLRAAQRDAIQAQARLGATQTEVGRLHKQLGDRHRALASRKEVTDTASRRADAAHQTLASIQAQFEGTHAEVEALVASRETLRQECAMRQAELDRAHVAIGDAQRTHDALLDRLTLLHNWHMNLEGYTGAVRALVDAPKEERPHIVGILARVVEPQEGYEAAVEAALGPFAQAVLTASARDAIACADWLRQHGAGFALVLWPDPAPTSIIDKTRQFTTGPREGLRPLAEYASILPEYRSLLDRLLRNVFVVESLDASAHGFVPAHTSATSAPDGDQPRPTISVVTRSGELLHRDGWLRGGGSAPRPGQNPQQQPSTSPDSLLAHERDLRRLPPEIERAARALAADRTRYESMATELAHSQAAAASLNQSLQATESRAQDLARQVTTAQRDAERAQSDLQLSQAIVDQLSAELAGIEEEVTAATQRAVEQEARQSQAAEAVLAVQESLDEIVSRNRVDQEEVAHRRTELAVHRQEVKTLAQRVEQSRAQVRDLTQRLDRDAERMRSITIQQAEVDRKATELHESATALRERLRESAGEIGECEASLAHIEGVLAQADRDQAAARQELSTLEADYRHAMVAAQRARDALDALAGQMREETVELGELSAEATSDDVFAWIRLGSHTSGTGQTEAVSSLSSPEQLTSEAGGKMRRQIDQLRSRLRQLGGFDPDAPQAYEELKTRHEFLSSQVRDMEQGATNLRTIIGELDATMRRQFAETFAAVNVRFQRHFTALFSGGNARLELTAPRRQSAEEEDDGESVQPGTSPKGIGIGGIEVYVQIPGKRVQDLSLLSGGERAMVSVALLFALLETNPPPFCLLDEVDAALDEANVVRFCDILHSLAESTQFIVITHNRVTMTYAGAIYGVSMGDDSISRILSMRLADVPVPS